jgi:hypothetical protein
MFTDNHGAIKLQPIDCTIALPLAMRTSDPGKVALQLLRLTRASDDAMQRKANAVALRNVLRDIQDEGARGRFLKSIMDDEVAKAHFVA